MSAASVIPILAPIVALAAALLAYRRSGQSGKASEQTAAKVEARADWTQDFEVLQAALDRSDAALDQAQEDNKELRLNGRANRLEWREAIERCKAHVEDCETKLERYRKQFGDLE